MQSLSPEQLEALRRTTQPRLTRYIPVHPTVKQQAFLLWNGIEGFYGGAAGGGKSVGLLMAALQYVDVPGYSALLLRRTYTDLNLPGALMDTANEWLRSSNAMYSALTHCWRFPCERHIESHLSTTSPSGEPERGRDTYVSGQDVSIETSAGASLTFGFLESENDKYRYQSSEFQFIGVDELTQLTESQYTYLFSRLRRLKGSNVPLRMRGASNPGGVGHEWVKEHFITSPAPDCLYIPAGLQDNPYLDTESYESALRRLDPITQAQLLHGDWNVRVQGNMFRREWFELVETPLAIKRKVRFWDRAATEHTPGTDPDYTAGVLLGIDAKGIIYVLDVQRVRLGVGAVDDLIRTTAELDGADVKVYQEQEGGSSGKELTEHTSKALLGFSFKGVPSTGSKVVRAQPASASAYNRHVKLKRAPWNEAFMSELELFPDGAHDDQVDAFAGAHQALARGDSSRFNVMHVGRVKG